MILKNGGKRKELKRPLVLFCACACDWLQHIVYVCVCVRARVSQRACVQMSQIPFIIYLLMENEPTDPCALAGDRHLTAMLQYRGAVSHGTLSVCVRARL